MPSIFGALLGRVERDEEIVIEDTLSGHAFAARRIREVVPGRVYALSGFEFTEYYFVVSDDRRQLIGSMREPVLTPPKPHTRRSMPMRPICLSLPLSSSHIRIRTTSADKPIFAA